MTQQDDFFSHPSQPETEPNRVIILNEPATNQPKKRVFVYDGQYFEDPGAEYTIEDVLNFLAGTYPELENGTWHSHRMPNDTEEITFVKVTGEKGMDVTTLLIAAHLGDDRYELLIPRFLAAGFHPGWPLGAEGEYLRFGVSKLIHLITPLPDSGSIF